MAYAGALFADACLRGLNGEPDVEEFSYVESQVVPELPFFSSRVRLGPNGQPLSPPPCQKPYDTCLECLALRLESMQACQQPTRLAMGGRCICTSIVFRRGEALRLT